MIEVFRSGRSLAIGLLAMGLWATGCAATDEVSEPPTSQRVVGAAGVVQRDGPKPVIELGVTDWTGARVTTAIVELIVERRLGYPVEPVAVVDNRAMFDQLASGQLDAVLEIWPATLESRQLDRLSDGSVEDLGPLGVEGKVGWFLPRSVVEADPELTDWEYLRRPEVAARFATDETGSRGRFLGTDPNFDQFDEQLIEALELPFDLEWSGSEHATFGEVERALDDGRPILLFWWTPTAEIVQYELVEVSLPPRTDECEARIEAGELVDCDYPRQSLLKAGWPDLNQEAPEVHRFLSAFSLTTSQQLALIDEIENEGATVGEAASRWVERNSDTWEAWLSG